MELFPYAVSVVIPVYNAEKNLGRTMDSLFQQTIQRDQVEIILIDDGSTDKSPELCDVYAMEHEHIRVIHQENAGVSAARNAGIRSAQGKYILFLDSDDAVSPETLKNTTLFFQSHYNEIDILTYPIAFCYEDGRKEWHYRGKIMQKTGVYDVNVTAYINLTTMNVVVKNRKEDNYLFDESLFFHEDEAYLTEIVLRYGKIGFVQEATYWYIKHDNAVTNRLRNPYYIFEPSMRLYEKLFERYKLSGRVNGYIQQLVLNDFNWKISQNSFYPYHLKGEALEIAMLRIGSLLNYVDAKQILEHPNLDSSYKYFLLSLKTENRPFLNADNKCIQILNRSGILSQIKSILLVLNCVKIEKDSLYILGYIKCVAFAFSSAPVQLYSVEENGDLEEVSLFYSQHSHYWTNFETNRFWAFHYHTSLNDKKKLRFRVRFLGKFYTTDFWYTSKLRVHPEIGNVWQTGEQYRILCQKNEICIYPTGGNEVKKKKQAFQSKLFHERRKQWFARNLMSLYSGKRVWLYFDSHDSLDNGYYQFQHDFQKRDGIKRYYVYHADNPELIKGRFTKRQEHALVVFNSVRHKCLMAAAEKVLVAYIGRSTYLPFDPNTYQYYSDLFHYEVIYLQHGVMHAKLPDMYSKEKVWQADKIVASTAFEKENFLMLGYREEDILTCGMPRLDRLSTKTASTKRILFAPSWRVYLVKTVGRAQVPVDGFYHSQYYQRYTAFLNSLELKSFLTENDFYLDVQMHPMFSCYTRSFLKEESERIHMVSAADFSEYQMCITDFSSIMFDFVYLNKPVISFFPDRELFEAGLHSYHDFYYPLEDGFALYCEDEGAVIRALKQLQENHFKVPEKQRERSAALYYSREASHAEALYRALTGGE